MDAGWDEELLRIEIESLQGADFDVSLTGFGEDEIADLFAGDGEKDVKDDNSRRDERSFVSCSGECVRALFTYGTNLEGTG